MDIGHRGATRYKVGGGWLIMNTIEKEKDQAWKKRTQKIYQSTEELDTEELDTEDYEYLYSDNSNSCGLNYGEYDYSEYPEERGWYWKKWW